MNFEKMGVDKETSSAVERKSMTPNEAIMALRDFEEDLKTNEGKRVKGETY